MITCLWIFGLEKINAISLIFAYLLLDLLRVEPSVLHMLVKHSSTNLHTSSPVHSLILFMLQFYKNKANIKCFQDLNNRQKL